MRIHKRNLPRCSYTTNAKFKFPGYSGDLYAYVKDNNSIIMLNYSSFCRFVLAMMRQRFSYRFKFPTQTEFEDNMRLKIEDNLYKLLVLNDHMNQVEREAIDDNAVQTIIYEVFDGTVGYDIYLRIHHSIQDIKEMAPSPAKCAFEIGGQTPKEVFVHPCDYFNASFIRGKKEIQCIFYEGNIWYRFTDFNRMFNIQRTNLIANKTNVNDFVVYDGFLFCNDNEVKDAIIHLDISNEDKIRYLEAFDISTNDLTETEEDKSFTVNVANEEVKVFSSELETNGDKIIVPVELGKLSTKDKPKKGRKHTMKINIHEGKPNIIEEDKMVTVIAKVNKEIKDKAANLFNDLGLNMSSAINVFLHQCIIRDGIPFEIKKESVPEEINESIHEEIDNKTLNEEYISFNAATNIAKIGWMKIDLLSKLESFPKFEVTKHGKMIKKEEFMKWLIDNHEIVYKKPLAEIREMLGYEKEEEDDLQELLDQRSTETNNLVAFTIDRKFISGRHPAVYERRYMSLIGQELVKVLAKSNKDYDKIADDQYKFMKIYHENYDLTIVDRALLNVYRNAPVEFIFVKDNNPAEHGIGGTMPYDYIFVKAADLMYSISDFSDRDENNAKAQCSLALNASDINIIIAYSMYNMRSKFIQVNDVDKLFDFMNTREAFKNRLIYDSAETIKKMIMIELDEYVRRNRHNMEFKRKVFDYIDDFHRFYNNGVVDNMARHIFNDKTIKEILNSKDISEFTYGSIILSEAFRNILNNYRIVYKDHKGEMPRATGDKPTNATILAEVWDFINKSEYLTEIPEEFIKKVQKMEQRYNILLENHNKYVDEGKELDSIFDE